jgi:hypothetical protein
MGWILWADSRLLPNAQAVKAEKHSEQISHLGEILLRIARLMEDQARRTERHLQPLAPTALQPPALSIQRKAPQPR